VPSRSAGNAAESGPFGWELLAEATNCPFSATSLIQQMCQEETQAWALPGYDAADTDIWTA